MTTGIVIAFFLTSFTLAFFAKEKSVAVRDLGIPVVQEAVIPDPVDVLSDEGAGELPEFDDMSGEQQVDSEIPES
jgi:hypothetical protein